MSIPNLKTVLLSVGFQSLLFALCIHCNNDSFIGLQETRQSLSAVGCLCLFIWTVLYLFSNDKKPVQTAIPSNISSSNSDIYEKQSQSAPSPKTPIRMIRSPSKSLRNKTLLTSSNNSKTEVISSIDSVSKRSDYLGWNEYFLSVAMLSAMRSKDPSTQVGACIVNPNKRIVGIGYNGFPVGCSDDKLPWNRTSSKGVNDTKYPYVVHAEANAILNKNSANCVGCTMFVVLFPCNECAKLIIQSGIEKIIFMCDKYAQTDKVIAAKRLFDMAEVKYEQYFPKKKSILITFPQSD